jgi:hypothetical protein
MTMPRPNERVSDLMEDRVCNFRFVVQASKWRTQANHTRRFLALACTLLGAVELDLPIGKSVRLEECLGAFVRVNKIHTGEGIGKRRH